MSKGLVDTKREYVNFLQDLLAVPIAERLYDIYIECQNKGLRQFQKEMNKIPEWNNHIIQQEVEQIIEKTQCDYLDKILKITIISSVKLKFADYSKKINNISIKTPSVNDFIHKCFVYCSQFAWKHSYLFIQSNLKPVEIQNNMNIIEHEIRKLVARTISDYVNIKDVIEKLNKIIEKSMSSNQSSSLKKKKQTVKDTPHDTQSDAPSDTPKDACTKEQLCDNNITEFSKMCEKEFQDYQIERPYNTYNNNIEPIENVYDNRDTLNNQVKVSDTSVINDAITNNVISDRSDRSDRTKYFPNIPCWYLVNSFQCKQANCYFNHNPTFIKTHKDKREHCVCHLYLKCKEKCNKFHNMDELMELYNSANRKLNAVDNIMKT